MFDARSDAAQEGAFAERCWDDRHHFRFIISLEDAAEMDGLQAFTRELMIDVARDLGTKLDWAALYHWNTDNPHVHGRRSAGEIELVGGDGALYIEGHIRGKSILHRFTAPNSVCVFAQPRNTRIPLGLNLRFRLISSEGADTGLRCCGGRR